MLRRFAISLLDRPLLIGDISAHGLDFLQITGIIKQSIDRFPSD
ncbi:hypothetical protein D1BOALGB6SA_9783 [Olavius sp. associated proteobacterium Delta 1]|nr:hypothetical protein D1BOALGB6SA_9783 [Olavius sp. associated proteobacterium Delta 1]